MSILKPSLTAAAAVACLSHGPAFAQVMSSPSSVAPRATATLTAVPASPGAVVDPQVAAAAVPPDPAQPRLSPVVITGNPLRSRDMAAPHSVLAGEELVLRRGSSLGETLSGLPGVAATWFGPNSNRPVLRGQDGDRIRVLSNAGASLDASALSYDHAVPIDPLVVERIEVLRGPAALQYGGSAVGGVVNTLDNRIPRQRIDAVDGAAELRLGGAARERSLSALVEAGQGGLALHADAFRRHTEDLQVPSYERPTKDGRTERRNRVLNSAARAQGGALGLSQVWAQGHAGLSVDRYENRYGAVAEEDIHIRMQRDRLATAAELRPAQGPLRSLRLQAAATDYRHEEVEADGAIGTTFENRGGDARLEAVHRPVQLGYGQLEGSAGLQWESSRFSALGEEAFVPSTQTRQAALFLLERWRWGDSGHIGAGLRTESVRVRSQGDADQSDARFGPPRQRHFRPHSVSLEALWRPARAWQATAGWSYVERAPTSYELYADGVHAATGVYERGDTQQAMENGRHLDLALAWQDGPLQARLGAFVSHFGRWIGLAATGEPDVVTDEGETVAVYAFRGLRARLQGLEAEASWRVLTGSNRLTVEARFDRVQGRDLDSGAALPRLAPSRTTLAAEWGREAWTGRIELQHAAAQRRVPATDQATPGWTQLHLSGQWRLRLQAREALLFARLTNATDRLAYNATTMAPVRWLAPLPGRALTVGARLAF